MKKMKVFSIMLLFLSSILGVLPASATVSAQEQILVDVNVFLRVNGGEPIEQNQISYDIIQPNPEGGDGTVIYSYRSDNPPAEPLSLAPGNYRFRLFDGGNFYRDGQEILPYGFEQTIATLTEEDIANNLQKRPLDPGQINAWGDGTRVYDVPFSLATGDNIYNPSTGQYEVDLDFTLADAVSMENGQNDQDDSSNETDQDPEAGMSSIKVTVTDDLGNPMPNVSLDINGYQYNTNESGIFELTDLTEGQEIYLSVIAPEGYSGGGSSEPFIVQANNVYEVSISLSPVQTEGGLEFVVTDTNGQAIPNVEIMINDQAIYTNEFGVASLANLAVGGYSYQVTAVPEGYQAPPEGTVNIDADSLYTENITLQSNIEYGSVDIQVVDENQTPIVGSEIYFNDQVYLTNTEAKAIIEGVQAGQTYTYSLASLPAGYEATEQPAEQTLEVTADQLAQGTIQVGLAKEEGNAEFIVRDDQGQAVAGVTVTVDEQTATTDELGKALISSLAAGDYAYQLSNIPAGFQTPAEAWISVQTDNTTTQEINLQKEVQYGNVSIAVTDENDQAISGSQIIFNESVYPTNSEGIALIEGVQAGQTYTYSLSSLPEDFEAEANPEPQTLEVLANETAQGLIKVTRVKEEGDAEFILQDSDGQALAGLLVTINENTATTNDQGRALFENLAVGTHTYMISQVPEDLSGNLEGQVTINRDETAQVTETFQAVPKFGELAFIVKDQDGQVVQGTTITLDGTQFSANESGEIIIQELPAGQVMNYTLGQLPEGYTGQESATVTVPENDRLVTEISVQRDIAPGQIIITVLDQNSQAVASAQITLSNGHKALTNEAGQVQFTGLQPATYEYELTSLPENYQADLGPQSLNLAEGATEERQINVNRDIKPGSATIRVIDQEEKAVPGVVISVNDQSYTTNENGQIAISDLAPGTYTYSMTELPDKYTGATSGELTITEAEETTVNLSIERIITPATASLTVLDQDGQSVEGVVVAFGGLDGSTNSNGIVNLTALQPGNYGLSITSVPDGFKNVFEAKTISVEEGATIEETLTIERLPKVGDVRIVMVDNNNNPIANVEVELNGQKVKTDNQGQANFSDLIAGQAYEYKIVSLPEGFQMEGQTGQVTAVAEETTIVTLVAQKIEESSSESSESSSESSESESSSVSIEESSSITSEEQEEIDEEAQQATKQFVHADTGIEVWVNPADAGNVVRLDVQKVSSLAGLENADADMYQIRLLNKDNQAVNLTRIAEVKIPTRPVNSQLNVVRANNNSLSNLTFSLHNQRVTFRTQQLGNFAIVYRQAKPQSSQESESQTVNVNVESSVQQKDNLPNTGERSMWVILVLAVALVAGGLGLIFYRKKSSGEQEEENIENDQ